MNTDLRVRLPPSTTLVGFLAPEAAGTNPELQMCPVTHAWRPVTRGPSHSLRPKTSCSKFLHVHNKIQSSSMFHKAESEVAPVNCPHYSLCSSHAGLLAVPDKLQMDNGVSWCYTVCFGGTAKPFSKAVAPFNTPRAVDDGSDFSLFSPACITPVVLIPAIPS